ncbi:MAG: hypothetical protein BWY88_01017 [Synergistetes bacterium ADurb.Bin520]|nr:MAG: hypothetical protein BWY88_01017 [Synergistetes bacterium ADurb.Bin520]
MPRISLAEAVKEGGDAPSAERWKAPGGLSPDPGDPVRPKEGLAVRQGAMGIPGEEGGQLISHGVSAGFSPQGTDGLWDRREAQKDRPTSAVEQQGKDVDQPLVGVDPPGGLEHGPLHGDAVVPQGRQGFLRRSPLKPHLPRKRPKGSQGPGAPEEESMIHVSVGPPVQAIHQSRLRGDVYFPQGGVGREGPQYLGFHSHGAFFPSFRRGIPGRRLLPG